MSRFINYNLEPEGILTVPIVEIVKGFDRTRNRLEGEELSRIMEKFSSQEKNLLNSTNGRNMMVRCGALKKKLYRYASSSQSLVEKAMQNQPEQLMRDITHRIVLQKKYHRPLRKRQNFVQDIIETELFKNTHKEKKERKADQQRNKQTLRLLARELQKRLQTQPATASSRL